jgi:acyl-CoA synthetase (NDP forming)
MVEYKFKGKLKMKMENADRIIGRLKAQGRQVMTEYESKKMLKDYGVPVAKSKVVTSVKDAIATAQKIGFPVVVKGHGARLAHKTERGLVRINLKTVKEVREAFHAITAAAGTDGDGCLIAPFVKGNREFVAGLFRDPQFGPVVMFGLGSAGRHVFHNSAVW